MLLSLCSLGQSFHGSGSVVTNHFHLLSLRGFFFCLQFGKVVLLGQWSGLASVFSLVWASLTFKGYTADSAVIPTAHVSMGNGPSPLQHPPFFLGAVPLVFWWDVVWESVWGYLCSDCLIHLDATCLDLETFPPWFYSKFYNSRTCLQTLHAHHPACSPWAHRPWMLTWAHRSCTLTMSPQTLHAHQPARWPPCTPTMSPQTLHAHHGFLKDWSCSWTVAQFLPSSLDNLSATCKSVKL